MDAITMLPVTTAPIMLWRYCQSIHGFRRSPQKLSSKTCPLGPILYAVGCCIQASVAMMKYPESQEPAHTSTADNQCMRGLSRFSPNTNSPRKVDSRKKE